MIKYMKEMKAIPIKGHFVSFNYYTCLIVFLFKKRSDTYQL